METTLALLQVTAVGLFALGVIGIIVLSKAQSPSSDEDPTDSHRKRSIRSALSGLFDAIGSMF